MSDLVFGTWLSRIIRWALAAGLGFIAWKYDDLWFFYLLAAAAFITGFLVPKKCIEDSCNLPDKEA